MRFRFSSSLVATFLFPFFSFLYLELHDQFREEQAVSILLERVDLLKANISAVVNKCKYGNDGATAVIWQIFYHLVRVSKEEEEEKKEKKKKKGRKKRIMETRFVIILF